MMKHPFIFSRALSSFVVSTIVIVSIIAASMMAPMIGRAATGSWGVVSSPTTQTLTDVTFFNSDIGWAVGESGTILSWGAATKTWEKSGSSFTPATLWGVDAFGPSDAWAVGDSGSLLHFNGTAWVTESSFASTHLLDVDAVDAGTLWVVGDGGTIFEGVKTGSSFVWTQWSDAGFVSKVFYGVSFRDASDGWIVGSDGMILHWDGNVFAQIEAQVTDDLFDVIATGNNTAIVVGENGVILRVSTVGAERIVSPTGDASLLSVAMNAQGRGWIGGEYGTLLASADAGEHWQTATSSVSSALTRVFFPSEDQGWIVGTGGTIVHYMPLPAVPVLVNPMDAVVTNDAPLLFDWGAALYADTYTLRYATSVNFTSGVVTVPNLTASSYTPTVSDGTYYWKVWGVNTAGAGDISLVRSVRIDRTPPAIPQPEEPGANATVIMATPTLQWGVANDATRHELRLDDASPIAVTTNTYTPAVALGEGTHTWQVRSFDAVGNSSEWSGVQSFTVPSQTIVPPPDTTPPSVPTLLSPSVSATVTVRTPEFRWSGDTDVAEYDVQVFASGTTPPSVPLVVVASPWTSTDSLTNGVYSWRLRARDHAGNTSAWSTGTFTVTVASTITIEPPPSEQPIPPIVQPVPAPLVFSLTGPGSIITETKPVFTWSASVNATTYTLEIVGDGTAFIKTIANITTTSYIPAEALSQGKYFWKVTASNSEGVSVIAGSQPLIIDATPPPAPTLSEPSPDAQTTLPVALVWAPVSDNLTSVTYTVQVDDGNFSSPTFVTAGTSDVNAASTTTLEINAQNFVDTQYLITNGLTSGITYRWRVWAKDAAGNMSTAPSAVRSFIIPVPAVAPSAFTLAESSEVTIDATPTFQWTKSDGATAYTLFIQGNGANNTVTRAYPGSNEIPFTKLSYAITDPLPLGTYTWYVRATNSAGTYSAPSRLIMIATSVIEKKQSEILPPEPLPPLPPTKEAIDTAIRSGSIEETPTITVTLTSSATLATNRPLLSGLLSIGSTVAQVLIDEQPVAPVSIGASGAFVFASPIRLPDGEHTLRFMVDNIPTNAVTFFISTREPVSATVNDIVVARQQPGAVPGTMDLLIVVQASVDATTQSIALIDPTAKTTIAEETTTAKQPTLSVSVTRTAEQLGTHTLLLVTRDQFGESTIQQITYAVTNAPISYACSDGVDNDADGKIDYRADPGCSGFTDTQEDDSLLVTLSQQATVSAVTNALNDTAMTTIDAAQRFTEQTVKQTAAFAEVTDRIVQTTQPVTIRTLAAVAPAAIVVNPITASSLPALPGMVTNAFSWLFSALGIRKKRKNPWGMVYDAITKEPIGLAILRLFDAGTPITKQGVVTGQASQLLATQVTDKEGRFEFLVKPGSYRIEAQKTPFLFPSKIIEGKDDGELFNVYHGEVISVTTEGQAMHVNIPIDQENITLPRIASLRNTFQRIRRIASKASLPLLVIGTGISIVMYAFSQTKYNLLALLVYVGFAAYQTILSPKKVKSWGTIFDAVTLTPVSLAMVSIIDPQYQRVIKTRLSDYQGRFTFLPDPGNYQLKVTKANYQFPSKTEKAVKKYHHLYHGESLTVAKKKAIIAVDIPLDPLMSTASTPSVSSVPPSTIPPTAIATPPASPPTSPTS